jgi:hypothetical protein
METGTSLDEFAIQSDPERFDRTFRSTGADLDIEGRFDPAPGVKQVLPRLAYTINFQMVWNEDRERWEPQKKSSLGVTLKKSKDINPSFDTWFQPLPDNDGLLLVQILAETNGSTNGVVFIQVDESGGTTSDYGLTGAFADEDAGGGVVVGDVRTLPLPEGAQVRIQNRIDPVGANQIRTVRAFPLE